MTPKSFILVSILAGVITGYVTIHSPLAASWTSIFLWIAVGTALVYLSARRTTALYGGTAFGFFNIATWLIAGFQGASDKIEGFILLTLVLSMFGAACGFVGASLLIKVFKKI